MNTNKAIWTSLFAIALVAASINPAHASGYRSHASSWTAANGGGRVVNCIGSKCVVHQYKKGGKVDVIKLNCENGSPRGLKCSETGRNTVKY